MSEAEQLRLDPALLRVDPTAWIASTATVLGDVHVGRDATIWYGAVIRGDVEEIRIGAETNIQDGSILHADAGFPCVIAERVTVGHRALIHGARVERNALIGMASVIMNGAVIGAESVVGAGALVPERK